MNTYFTNVYVDITLNPTPIGQGCTKTGIVSTNTRLNMDLTEFDSSLQGTEETAFSNLNAILSVMCIK